MQTVYKPCFTKEILFSLRYSAYVIISNSEFLCIVYPIEKIGIKCEILRASQPVVEDQVTTH